MNKARQTILRLVAGGKITVEEADELLDAIDNGKGGVFSGFFDAKQAGERARAAGERAREAGERARERATRTKQAAKERAKAARARAKAGKSGWNKEYDYEGAFDFNWPWDQPDWQWPWEKEGWQWPWEKHDEGETISISQVDAPEEAQLEIRSNGGDLVIRGNDEVSMLRVSGLNAASHLTTDDKEIHISAAGADLEVEVPKNVISLEISQTGGDMSVSQLEADLAAVVAGGDMSVSGCTGKIQASVEGGDVSLASIRSTEVEVRANAGDISLNMLPAVEEGSVSLSADSGDISVVLPSDSRCEISANTGTGDIAHSLPLESTEIVDETENSLNAKLNGGGADFVLSTKSGDIAVRASVSPA